MDKKKIVVIVSSLISVLLFIFVLVYFLGDRKGEEGSVGDEVEEVKEYEEDLTEEELDRLAEEEARKEAEKDKKAGVKDYDEKSRNQMLMDQEFGKDDKDLEEYSIDKSNVVVRSDGDVEISRDGKEGKVEIKSSEGSASFNDFSSLDNKEKDSVKPGVDIGVGEYGAIANNDREFSDLDKSNKYSDKVKEILPEGYDFGAMGDDIMYIGKDGKPVVGISFEDDYEYSDYIAKGNINLDIYGNGSKGRDIAYDLGKLFGLELSKEDFITNLDKSMEIEGTFVKVEKYRFIKMSDTYLSVYWDR